MATLVNRRAINDEPMPRIIRAAGREAMADNAPVGAWGHAAAESKAAPPLIGRERKWTHAEVDALVKPYTFLLDASDDEDAGKPVSRHTWEQARAVLASLMNEIAKDGLALPRPSLDSTAAGGLHLLWQRPDGFVLVVLPAPDNENQQIRWFAHRRDGEEGSGYLRPDESGSRQRLISCIRE